MANDRIFIKCNSCGEKLFLGKSYYGGFYYQDYGTVPKTLDEKLNEFYEKHTYCKDNDLDGDFDIVYEIRNTKKDEQIAELKQQIAEKDKEIADWKDGTMICNYEKMLAEKDKEIAELEREVAEHNEYFECFACENFEEFQEFIGTFMLTPHEEQTYIRELENKVKHLRHEICEKIRKMLNECSERYTQGYFIDMPLYDIIEKVDQIERG